MMNFSIGGQEANIVVFLSLHHIQIRTRQGYSYLVIRPCIGVNNPIASGTEILHRVFIAGEGSGGDHRTFGNCTLGSININGDYTD